MRIVEPLKSQPDWTGTNWNTAKKFAEGFHAGAYALAREVLTALPEGDDGGKIRRADVEALLSEYAYKNARPCKGWAHEPKQ